MTRAQLSHVTQFPLQTHSTHHMFLFLNSSSPHLEKRKEARCFFIFSLQPTSTGPSINPKSTRIQRVGRDEALDEVNDSPFN